MRVVFRVVPHRKKGKIHKNEKGSLHVRLRGGRKDPDFSARTPIRIAPIEWDSKREIFKTTLQNPNVREMNIALGKFKNYIENKLNLLEFSGEEPDKEVLNQWVDEYFNKTSKGTKKKASHKIYISDYVDYFIENRLPKAMGRNGKEMGKASKEQLKSNMKKFKQYEKDRGIRLKWKNFDASRQRDMIHWLSVELGKEVGTVNNFISKTINVFNNFAKELDQITIHESFPSNAFRQLKKDDNLPTPFLTLEEQETIAGLDLVLQPELDAVRDWLLWSCDSGMAWSDMDRFNPEKQVDWEDKIIRGIRKKTNTEFAFRYQELKWVNYVFNKYRDGVPPMPNYKDFSVRRHHFNVMLREVCKLAGINEPLTVGYSKSGQPITEPKWQLASSHIGRISCATNNDGLYERQTLLMWMGWKDSKQLEHYIKSTTYQRVKKMGRLKAV